MKLFNLLVLLLLVISCKEEELEVYDDLTPSQQQAVTERSRLKCMSEFESVYERFKEDSAESVFDSSRFEREDGFYHEFKGPSSTRKVDIRVWKQDLGSEATYFYITEDMDGASSYFLKITKAQNDAMIDQLLDDHCRKFYTTSSGRSGPLKVLYEFDKPNSPNRDFYDDTYTLSFNYPAFFGRFNKSRTIEKKDADDDRVGELSKFTSTFKGKGYDFDGHDVATDANYYTQNFCEPSVEPTSGKWRFSNDTTGTVQSLNMTCVTALPATWDLTIN